MESNRDILIPRQEPAQPKKKKADDGDPLAGLEGFERLQAVGNALGSTIMYLLQVMHGIIYHLLNNN